MADVYTPTKSMEGGLFPAVDNTESTSESAAVYVPTPIAPSTSTPLKPDDQTTRQKYGVGDAYSPSNPGIRIVKRKPKTSTDACPPPIETKRRATENSDDPAVIALKSVPKKSILRMPVYNPNKSERRICFADSKNLPLCHIKEIERIAAIHSNVADFRCSERNEAAVFGRDHEAYDDVDWGLVKVRGTRLLRRELSESGKREEKRISESGIMRGAMFGMYTLEDIPQLNEQAATDLAGYRPTPIPTISVKGAHMTLSALRALPLPGRPRPQPQPQLQPQAPQMKYNHPPPQMNHQQQHPHQIYQNQNMHHQAHPTYNQYSQKQYSPSNNIYEPSVSKPIIQQVFQESEPINNYYTATTSLPDPEPAPKSSSPKFELPANLKEMLSQLKKKGFVSSDEEPSSTTAPEESTTTDPLVAAMQTAQQMMQNQQLQTSTTNTYASEESSQDYPMDGYVATFATPEMMAQERRQDSQNSEGWTQSGWKIQEPCVYFINRPGGCNRGDQCRFLHDEELRRQRMAELPPRGSYHQRDHEDRGFRGDRRGRAGFRGGFRNNNHHHHDRDFRENNGGYRNGTGGGQRGNRFGDHDGQGYRGGRFNRGGYGRQNQSRFDKKGEYNQQNHYQQLQNNATSTNDQSATNGYNGHQEHNSKDGPSPPKRQRISRFDQRQDDELAASGDVDHRLQKRNDRPFRSRFDQAIDQDDRAQTGFNL